MMELTSLDKLFHIEYGNGLELVNLQKNKSGTNFVARTQKNNGVVGKVVVPVWEHTYPKGCITVAVSGSVMESFLQTEDFVTGYHIMVLTPIYEMSDEVKLFYCHCLRINKFKYSYGRQANITLPSLRVPCLTEAKKFVEGVSINKTRERMFQWLNLNELKEYPASSGNDAINVPLHTIFEMRNGVASTGLERIRHKRNANWIPYIRPSYRQSTSIDAYVNRNILNENDVYPNDTLYVSTNGQGSHTYSYVSTCEFVPNSDVTVLIPKRDMTLREKLFYAMCITHNRFKFSYGRKPKGQKLAEILIPNKMPIDFDTVNIENII